FVRGDAKALVRIVSALISNGLKHTDGAVSVVVSRDGDEVVIEVRDQGPGIPAWEQERIFERFGRSGDHLHRSQGPGLGLPIARSLAEQLGGCLELDSRPGEGSTFTLRLPGVARLSLAS
ncbi:MAG: ATP-binding protein, partial [Nitriliruptorales bacterium]|nr:ATP-binding protein [Nitriliruptorales bacterium]